MATSMSDSDHLLRPRSDQRSCESSLLGECDPTGTEFRTALAGPLAVGTITKFLGLEGVTPDDVLGWYGSIADAIIDLTTSGRIDHADQQAVDQIRSHVMTSIDDDRASAVLQSVRESGALEAEELTSAALVIMFGAIETAEGMTTNALWHLFDEPERWRRVRNDRALLANAIDESLRLEPAASLVDRYATVDTTLGDVNISAGDLVSINLLAANRDPAFFDLPNEFDIQRSNAKQHVTFVQGPHACLGVHLTRLETA